MDLKSGKKDATHLQMTFRLTIMLSPSPPCLSNSLHFFLSLTLSSLSHMPALSPSISPYLFLLHSTSTLASAHVTGKRMFKNLVLNAIQIT